MDRLSDRVRVRLREEMAHRKLTQEEVSDLLGGSANGWSQSRVAKYLTGRVELTVDALATLCFALGLSVTESVRDQGLEFCAEMTPTELKLLEHFRNETPEFRNSLLNILRVPTRGFTPKRFAKKPKSIDDRPPKPRLAIEDKIQ